MYTQHLSLLGPFMGLSMLLAWNQQYLGIALLASAYTSLFFLPKTRSFLFYHWEKTKTHLARLINAIILGLLFYLILSPIAFLSRKLRRPILSLKEKNSLFISVDKTYDKPFFEKPY